MFSFVFARTSTVRRYCVLTFPSPEELLVVSFSSHPRTFASKECQVVLRYLVDLVRCMTVRCKFTPVDNSSMYCLVSALSLVFIIRVKSGKKQGKIFCVVLCREVFVLALALFRF